MSTAIRLGLIGDNIAASQAPRLHELAGAMTGRPVTYERLVPRDVGLGFDELFDHCARSGFRGVNVTYPYKERAFARVTVDAPRVRALGAVNTVLFGEDGPKGYNTDHSGFIAAYRGTFGDRLPGSVCMAGGGGVGKAVAFGLLELGVARLTIVERDIAKAEALATALRGDSPDVEIRVTGSIEEGIAGAQGLVNCTPVGMDGHDGTPFPAPLIGSAEWAFDAVYTPRETRFLSDAAAKGLAVLSGYELFFYQGLHAFELFHGVPMDEAALRAALMETA